MRVLITGATGLIGTEIVKICEAQNIKVNYLTTRKSKIKSESSFKGFYWNPNNKEIDKDCFKGVDAIIHLAGASIAKRWTKAYKEEIISSRVESTKLLIESLKTIDHHVNHIIAGSAIGIYPDDLEHCYNESFKGDNNSFLGRVVKVWEAAVDGFDHLNIKTTKIRTGLVLSTKGGAMVEMIKPIKFGLGAAFGTGKHWQSWIHVQDLAALFMHVLNNKLYGVYNGVAPSPVTNMVLTKKIASALNKPFFMPNIPRFVMRMVLGEMHQLLFESQKVSSEKIEQSGFMFQYKALDHALNDLL